MSEHLPSEKVACVALVLLMAGCTDTSGECEHYTAYAAELTARIEECKAAGISCQLTQSDLYFRDKAIRSRNAWCSSSEVER